MAKGPLIILSGPSGSGKSTVVKQVLAAADVPLRLAVSATTRDPRPGEQDGVQYHFWKRPRFEQEVAAGAFLARAGEYDYQIINDDLATAIAELLALIRRLFAEGDRHAG